MRIVRKDVYYCDFCKKKSLRNLTEHEKHCTGNPDRECRICGREESLRPLIEKFKSQISFREMKRKYPDGEEYSKFEDVKYPKIEDIELAVETDYGFCPACKLAIIRGIGILNMHLPIEWLNNYDREKDFADYWRRRNNLIAPEGYY